MEDGAVRADWRVIDVVDDAWANDALPDDGASRRARRATGRDGRRDARARDDDGTRRACE